MQHDRGGYPPPPDPLGAWEHHPPPRQGLALQRLVLDAKVAPLHDLDLWTAGGWVRTTRRALQMSTSVLAERMGVTGRRVRQLERAEPEGHVHVTSLVRAAQAMDCRLVYAFVPSPSFDGIVLAAARRLAPDVLAEVAAGLGFTSPAAMDDEALLAFATRRRGALWPLPRRA